MSKLNQTRKSSTGILKFETKTKVSKTYTPFHNHHFNLSNIICETSSWVQSVFARFPGYRVLSPG